MARIVFVIANPTTSELTGWPIGYWLSELAHPFWEFTKAGHDITLASPEGGPVVHDGISDPDHPSGNARDFVSRGFASDPAIRDLLSATIPTSQIDVAAFDAIFVVGGLSPMYTFAGRADLCELVAAFHAADKPTALVCHGTCLLLDARTAEGQLLVEGKSWTGFSNAEEDIIDANAGRQVEPFRIQDRADQVPGTRFIASAPFVPHAIADGQLITGQQGNSGAAAATLLVAALS
jgi:putative intracellular protease/amidase